MMMKYMLMSFGAVFLSLCLMLTGCTISQTDEFVEILNLMSPAVEGIVPIVALTNPAAVGAVQTTVTTFENSVKEATNLYTQWKSASAAAQPGVLNQLQAVVSGLKLNVNEIVMSAHITNPVHAAAVDGIVASVLDEIANIAGIVGKVNVAGGTTTAASKVILHAMYGGGEEFDQDGSTGVSPGSTKGHKTRGLGHGVHTARHFKSELRAHLNHKTGDAKLDAVTKQLASKFN